MELTSLVNIGREMASKLRSVEIDSAEKLLALGAKEAFFRLKTRYPQVCLVHLYVLEGAICGIPFHCLTEEKKAELKAFCDSLKKREKP